MAAAYIAFALHLFLAGFFAWIYWSAGQMEPNAANRIIWSLASLLVYLFCWLFLSLSFPALIGTQFALGLFIAILRTDFRTLFTKSTPPTPRATSASRSNKSDELK